MAEVNIPFLPEFREAMLTDQKTMTSRFKRYGDVGDEFEAFGGRYRLLRVERISLGWVACCYWRAEGFESEQAFWVCWRKIHLTRHDPNLKVWVHEYEKVSNG